MTDRHPTDDPELDAVPADAEDEEEAGLYEHFAVTADKGQTPMRLDKFLTVRMEHCSRNRIQAAAVMADPAADRLMPEAFAPVESPAAEEEDLRSGGLARSLRLLEEKLIKRALARCSGNVTEAARELHLPRSTLVSKLKKLVPPHNTEASRPQRRQLSRSGAPYGYYV